jgi:hypothetical protein
MLEIFNMLEVVYERYSYVDMSFSDKLMWRF